MLYRCDEERIVLEKEIDFLKDYIALEKHKFKNLRLELSWPARQDSFLIAPLILLPFCENCFKHVKSTTGQESFIKIHGKIINQNLVFTTFNTCNASGINSNIKGIGIKNVSERLAILYENKHELKIEAKENTYQLQLTIALESVY
jgi:LytS/YehU family sensor histidine kinase